MTDIVLILHNIRSTHNVGSILRTADGLGVTKVFLTGYSPYPAHTNDSRLPHISRKLTSQISKTALGAENTVEWEHKENINDVVDKLKKDGYQISALEQTPNSTMLNDLTSPNKIAVIAGPEVKGLDEEVLAICDSFIEIPMFGNKESFNVAVATAICVYHLRFSRQITMS